MNGKIWAACLATIALVAAVTAAPPTRLEKALNEADQAFREAAVAEVQVAVNKLEGIYRSKLEESGWTELNGSLTSDMVTGGLTTGEDGDWAKAVMELISIPWKLLTGLLEPFKATGKVDHGLSAYKAWR